MPDEPRLLDLFGPLGSAAIADAIPAEFEKVEPVTVPERSLVVDDARQGIVVCGNQPEQQLMLTDCMPGWTLASGGWGCIAGDSMVTLADGSSRRIDLLWALGQSVEVMTTWGPQVCPPPARYEPVQLYRVTLEGGQSIEVTAHHQFFAGAWLPLSELHSGLALLCPLDSHCAASLSGSRAGDPHCRHTAPDSPSGYHREPHSRDRQPRSQSDIGLSVSPPPGDARARSRRSSRADDPACRPEYIQTCPRDDRRASNDSQRRSGTGASLSSHCELDIGAPSQQCSPPVSQSLRSDGQPRPSTESVPHGSEDRCAWDSPRVEEQVYRVIHSIQPTRIAHFYDINVPNYGHYCANGMWHHNSGKSFIGSRKFLFLHRVNMCPGMMIAPTWGDLARVMAPYLIKACMDLGIGCQYWPHGHGLEQFPHMVVFGQVIYLFSGESPERITGVECGHGWGDESARFISSDNPLRDAPTQIVGRLRHKKARTLHFLNTTTPEGLDTWIQRDFYDKPKPNYRAYVLATSKNTALPASVIENYRSQVPAALQRQYLEGYAVDYAAGRAHPNFTVETHCRPIEMDLTKPVHIGADFNISPMCWVAAQEDGAGNLLIFDEIVLEDNAQVDRAVQTAHDKLWCGQGRRVILHPDKSAKARSTTGNSEINELMQTADRLGWQHDGDAFGANPPIISRINLLERNLKDATGRIRIYIDPRCVRLIFELQRVKRKPDGSYDPGKDKKWGHILDGAGYMIWDVLPAFSDVQFSRY